MTSNVAALEYANITDYSGPRVTKRRTGLMASALVAVSLLLTSCAGMSSTEQRTLSGGAIGASVGAVGTALTGGCVACGAAIGGAVGAGAGYIYDKSEKSKNK